MKARARIDKLSRKLRDRAQATCPDCAVNNRIVIIENPDEPRPERTPCICPVCGRDRGITIIEFTLALDLPGAGG